MGSLSFANRLSPIQFVYFWRAEETRQREVCSIRIPIERHRCDNVFIAHWIAINLRVFNSMIVGKLAEQSTITTFRSCLHSSLQPLSGWLPPPLAVTAANETSICRQIIHTRTHAHHQAKPSVQIEINLVLCLCLAYIFARMTHSLSRAHSIQRPGDSAPHAHSQRKKTTTTTATMTTTTTATTRFTVGPPSSSQSTTKRN